MYVKYMTKKSIWEAKIRLFHFFLEKLLKQLSLNFVTAQYFATQNKYIKI